MDFGLLGLIVALTRQGGNIEHFYPQVCPNIYFEPNFLFKITISKNLYHLHDEGV